VCHYLFFPINIYFRAKRRMANDPHISMKIPPIMAGRRLDQVLAELHPEYSRARWQGWIKGGQVTVDQKTWRTKDKVKGDEKIEVNAILEAETTWQAQDMSLSLLYEDEDVIVVNKPAGLVVHPGAGNEDGTLVNALLHHAPELEKLPRAGIIHRLDKETSGVLIVARSLPAHKKLVEQLQAREFKREYFAVVNGVLRISGKIDEPLGRHPTQRTRRAVVHSASGKPAITHYQVNHRFRAHTLLKVQLETGRTHQIRVHMAHINYPVVGDPTYGGRMRMPPQCHAELRERLQGFRRQALHAFSLGLQHPTQDVWMEWESPLADDLMGLVQALKLDEDTAVTKTKYY
jgi:23S rRNA pseudouridine1911/1915/1917 synthase